MPGLHPVYVHHNSYDCGSNHRLLRKSKILASKTIYLLLLLSVMTTFANFAYAQPSQKGTQLWTDTENGVKILFTYTPKNPAIGTQTVLKFYVSNPLTDNHLRNLDAAVVIITNTSGQERTFKFNKLYAPNGDFSVKLIFPDSGIYQVITHINSNNPPSISLATFTVIVAPEISWSIIITIAIIIAIIGGTITNFIRTKQRRQSNYVIVAAFGIMILISTQPALLEFTERDLAYHMILEHTLFFILGALSVMVAEAMLKLLVSSNNKRKGRLKLTMALIWTKLLRRTFTVNRYVWLILAAGLITFWHIPSVFDFTELHEQIHVAQHISFVLVGAMGLLAIRSLGESFKLFVLFALNGIMGFAGLMFSVLDKPIYLVYSVNSHNNAGTWMLVVCIILLVIVLPSYLIHRTLLHVRIKLTSNSRPSQI